LEIFFPLSIRHLCKLFPILPTVLPHILAYALPFLFSVFPCLMFHFPLLKSFQRIHLSSNRAVILCNILVFCHPTPNIECHPFLAVCHYLLIIFAATLHIWKLSPPSSGWFSRKMAICFRFSNVTCEMQLKCGMWLNINWGNLQPLTVTGSSELPVFFLCLEVEGCKFVPELVTAYHVTWGTSVDCSVMIILAGYVLCLQFKKRQ